MDMETRRRTTLLILWGWVSLLLPAAAAAGEAEKSYSSLRAPLESAGPARGDIPVPQAGAFEEKTDGSLALSAAVNFNVYFVNVGQGDAQYIELPSGQNVLIDGGPSGSRIGAFLQERGVTSIDHVVLTHPHSDHYRGLGWVFDHTEVRNFYDTQLDNTGSTGDEAIRVKAAAEPDCATHYPRVGERLDWGSGASVLVLNSCPDRSASGTGMDGGAEINNCSISLKIAAGGFSVLFPGDSQEQAERAMVARFGDALRSNVLKVGHHGSRESSSPAFLAAVQPKTAVISVGKNGYGLPTDDAIGRLEAVNAAVYRTDRDGTLQARPRSPGLYASDVKPLP
ncbi:MAG: hypothetical protein A2X36_02630 [Elusimicrobia bacterium GWA2_69_24]|nr:MAG: hypothetical protein A2X36_02630 [Elusimicrobia bacterium GWA2_69_24]